MKQNQTKQSSLGTIRRVIGLDAHPDTFAAAILEGNDAESARCVRSTTKQPLETLEVWMKRFTRPGDTVVFEASGNSFSVAERLRALGREPVILESFRASKIGEAYLANDRIDAIKIGRIYLSGLASVPVWQPDAKTRERRELFSSYNRCVQESTRAQHYVRSFLNEHSLRLPSGFRLCRAEAIEKLLKLKKWSVMQRLLLSEMHGHLIAVRARRQRLRRMMALEIESDPILLRLYKLSGLNLVTTFGVISVIGDVRRFKTSKKLVSYIGLNPSTVQSGEWEGSGAMKRHGSGIIRSMLIQAAKRLLQTENPLQKWGLSVALRRGSNRAGVAVARKLVVAIWHVMQGDWKVVAEVSGTLATKIFKLATELGVETLKQLGYPSKKDFQEKKIYVLRTYA